MSRGAWIRRSASALACGALAAYLVVHLFGVAGQSDVNPPICTNSFGNVIDCATDSIVHPIAWVSLVAVPILVLAIQARRSRS